MNSINNLFKDMITQSKRICLVEIEKRDCLQAKMEEKYEKDSVQKVLNRIKSERLMKIKSREVINSKANCDVIQKKILQNIGRTN